MKILHTSDWHMGRSLYGKKRYEEAEAFLDWLTRVIEEENIDVILVAGDIFDNSTPSNRVQELYYRFLARSASSAGRHVVIIAGNHDSPSLLNAPKGLLKILNVHVVGSASDAPDDEVIMFSDSNGQPQLLICAIPYLRDRDVRTAEAGESVEDKERKTIEGIAGHYRAVCHVARERRDRAGQAIPIVACGHLFTSGGRTTEGDGVRDLYIGSLGQVRAEIFPDCIDYLALGHLHIPQKVGGSDVMRYSGSPLPIGFNEAEQDKSVAVVEFIGKEPFVRTIPVPRFQELKTLRGDWGALTRAMGEMKLMGSTAWLEIVYEGDEIAGNLWERLDEFIRGTAMEILKVQNNRIVERALNRMKDTETLDELDIAEVFERCLDTNGIPGEQRRALMDAYSETILSLNEEDPGA